MKQAVRLIARVATCLAIAAPAMAQETADRIWSGGPIITMNDKGMRAEAVAEKTRDPAGGVTVVVLCLHAGGSKNA